MGTNGGYGRNRPRFTPEERKEILAASDAGESPCSIAKRYDCSPGAIYYHLKTTLRHVPLKDRYTAAPTSGHGACIRCGIEMGRVGMCMDCLQVEGVVV